MNRITLINKKALFGSLFTVVLGGFLVFAISYHTLKKIAYAGDKIFHGKNQSEVEKDIRNELLKYPNITSVSFKNSEDLTLAGLLVFRANAKANLIACHGFKSSKELLYRCIKLFPDWNILLFDFRAHGQSEGQITTMGYNEYKDVFAAKNFIKQTLNQDLPCIMFGLSMGAAAVIKAASYDQNLCDAIIADSCYAQLSATLLDVFSLRTGLPYYPFFPLIKYMFQYVSDCNIYEMNPVKYMKNVSQPILLIHSCDDEHTAPQHSVMLFAQAKNPLTKLWIAPHCRHGWLHTNYPDLYRKKVNKFLKKVFVSQ